MLTKTRPLCVCLVLALVAGRVGAEAPALRRLPLNTYRDKMQGAWLGQMAGVGWGAPTEFKVRGAIIPEEQMPAWLPAMINQHGNDDCYVEMTFLKTLEDYGLDVGLRQAGIDFANSTYRLWHANQFGRENLRQGIAPPDSGHPQFNAHADDIDYQIESDFAGIISPGLPNQAIALGRLFGHLMNYGDGVYAGQFVAAMYGEAFFEANAVRLIESALRCIPAQSQYAEMVRDLLQWRQAHPDDWQHTWRLIEDKYHQDPKYTHGLCSKPGGEKAYSIDVKLNGAYILMGLLYGAGDPDQTITIACRCGQDSDCNPSNAAGILFTTLGAAKIPPKFTQELDLRRKFSHTQYTLPKVYEVCEELARQAVLRAGGRIEKDAAGAELLLIPVETPQPSALEQSSVPGPIADSRFTRAEMAQIKLFGQESRSRRGNRSGSINDGDVSTFVVTFDGQRAEQDWYALTFNVPVTVLRVRFAHGAAFHNGGWFDTSAGRPLVQVQRVAGGPWETAGELDSYPATTAATPGDLKPGQISTLWLAQPIQVVAVRVVGVPASGDNPQQAFSSCAELGVDMAPKAHNEP